MAKKAGKLAKRYARAFLGAVEQELGREGRPIPAQQTAAQLNAFVRLWKENGELSLYALSPLFASEERERALLEVAKEAGVPQIVQRFLRVLFKRGRIGALEEIAAQFAELADRAAGVVQVEVIVANQIDEEERRGIEEAISSRIDGAAVFKWRADADLLGGMVIRHNGRVVDGSLSGRLERLERSLVG